MANRIWRGKTKDEPCTINLPVAGAYLPGTFVVSDGTKLDVTTDGTGRNLLLSSREFYTQGVTDAYEADETGIAYRPRPDDEFQAVLVAAAYTVGQELTIGAGGQMAAAVAGNVVVAFFDEPEGRTLAAAGLADVVIANSYVKA